MKNNATLDMSCPDILVFYEHVARELDVACAVSGLLDLQYGISSEIVQWPVGLRAILKSRINPRLIVIPNGWTVGNWYGCLLRWRKAIYFNIAWEQLFYEGNRVAKLPNDEFSTKHLVHHAWAAELCGDLNVRGVSQDRIL